MNELAISEELSYVVGVGASAGGLEAITDFLNHFPEKVPCAIVITQHLSPSHKSRLVHLLSRQSKWEVIEVSNNMEIIPGKVYITPPDTDIYIEKEESSLPVFNEVDELESTTRIKLFLAKPLAHLGPKPSVDVFFASLAKELQNRAIGVILSGTGSDGAQGIKNIRESDGFTIVQEPSTAKYDGMPLSAIETGFVDIVTTTDKMGDEIKEHIENPNNIGKVMQDLSEDQRSLKILFELLSRKTGTDFSQYKPATIYRRLIKRLEMLKITNLSDYISLIESKTEELDTLFKMILIGVTEFFRDREAFDELESYLVRIISSKRTGESIRIWVPGTSSGEEAYSIAILISKILREKILNFNVQIFATDIDENAILVARKGIYPEKSLSKVSDELINEYFIRRGTEYELVKSIRSLVLFSKHDLTNNPPFLKLDLICCRNLLIYFSGNLQKHIFPIFHYSLNNEGFLFLGKSESIGQFTDLFTTLSNKFKIYQKRRTASPNLIRFGSFKSLKQNRPSSTPVSKTIQNADIVKDTLFNNFQHPRVLINDNMDIIEIFGDVSMLLGLNQGVMNSNIIKLANPEIQIELRACISKSIKEKKVSKGNPKKLHISDKIYSLIISVMPAVYNIRQSDLFVVVFEKIELDEILTPSESLPNSFDNRILELEQELAATREHLQTFIEELETSNEELQSLNEEMMSTNEELQSSNEELETSNEELQSTNEELNIAYAELKSANEMLEKQGSKLALSEANATALLNNTSHLYILLDLNYGVVLFNKMAAETFLKFFKRFIKNGDSIIDFLQSSELPDFQKEFQNAIRGIVMYGEKIITDPTTNKKNWFSYSLTPVEINQQIALISYSLLDITEKKRAEINLKRNEILLNRIFNKVDVGMCLANANSDILNVNEEFCRITKYSNTELIDRNLSFIFSEAISKNQRLTEKAQKESYETRILRKDNKLVNVHKTVSVVPLENEVPHVIITIQEVSIHKEKLEYNLYRLRNEKEIKELRNKFLNLSNFELNENLTHINKKVSYLLENNDGLSSNSDLKKTLGDIHVLSEKVLKIQEEISISLKSEIDKIFIDPTRLNLNNFINKISNEIQSTFESDWNRIRLRIQKNNNIEWIEIDEVLVLQILLNLISNSFKYSLKGFDIDVEIRIEKEELLILVSDKGIGIPEEDKPNIFFFRYRASNVKTINGYGIGLTIVQRCVELLKGSIEFQSSIGKGTTFSVSIPLSIKIK